MATIKKVSRRQFLEAAAGLSATGLLLQFTPPAWARASAAARDTTKPVFEPSVYIQIDEAGVVRLIVHRSEMGQGARTAVAMLLAEELEVGRSDVVLEQAVGDKKYGNQNTDGSTTVRLNWDPLRKAGAAAREMLIAAGATKLSGPVAECHAEQGRVHHRSSGRSVGYGEVAAAAATLQVPAEPKLKDRAQWRLIGKSPTAVDTRDVVQGKARYGLDLHLPGMLYATIERSPTIRGKLKSFDQKAALAVRGVKQVLELPAHPQPLNTNAGVAVIAEHTWAALKGREALTIEWDHGTEPLENTPQFRAKLEELGNGTGKVARKEGDFAQAKAGAARVLSAQYHGPYLAHAPMEPLAAVARFADGRCEVWAPTQDPQTARERLAAVLGIGQENVTVNVTLLGGGFGRKSKPDFILEAAQIAKQLPGVPIKLTWTREDEIRHGFYRAQNFQRVEATIDAQNQLTGWRQHTVFPTIMSTFVPGAAEPSGFELSMGLSNLPYRIPNIQLESSGIKSDLRIGWLRSVCNTFHAHAINCFLDEVAEAVKKDPVAYRLELLGEPRVASYGPHDEPYKMDTARLARVIQAAAAMSSWGKARPAGVGHGFASHFSFLCYVAVALEASLDGEGKPKVHAVDLAVDCGTVVHPDNVVAQMEGAVAFALSYALYGAITVKDGAVEQRNFGDYELLSIGEMPKVRVQLLDSTAPPLTVIAP